MLTVQTETDDKGRDHEALECADEMRGDRYTHQGLRRQSRLLDPHRLFAAAARESSIMTTKSFKLEGTLRAKRYWHRGN